MWANSVWSVFGLGCALVLARISMIWTAGHEEWGPRFETAAVVCFSTALMILILPLLRRPPRVAAVGIVVSFVCLVGFSAWFYTGRDNTVVIPYLPKPLTLRNLFDTDFASYAGLTTTTDIILRAGTTPTGDKRSMPWKALWDLEAKSSFLSFFIEAYPADTQRAISQADFVLEHYGDFLNEADNSVEYLSPNRQGETAVTSVKDLTFSGRIYLYIPDFLTVEQQAAIIQMFKGKQLSLSIRAEPYRLIHAQEDRIAYLSSDWNKNNPSRVAAP